MHFQFKRSLSVMVIRFHSDIVVHCGLCQVLFSPPFLVVCIRYFPLFLLVFEPQQCKFYTSMMKSNLLDVQMLSLSSFMAWLE